MLTESAVLAVAGGVCALLFSSWTLDAFVWLAPAGIPRLEDVRLDTRVAAFAIAVATAAGLLFGLVPALQVHRRVEQDALRSAGRGMVTGHTGARVTRWLSSRSRCRRCCSSVAAY